MEKNLIDVRKQPAENILQELLYIFNDILLDNPDYQ